MKNISIEQAREHVLDWISVEHPDYYASLGRNNLLSEQVLEMENCWFFYRSMALCSLEIEGGWDFNYGCYVVGPNGETFHVGQFLNDPAKQREYEHWMSNQFALFPEKMAAYAKNYRGEG